MVHTRQCNIDNFYDRGSYRMRYISVGLLTLAIRMSNNPDYCPLAGPLFTITCMFSIIIGGLSVCHEIRRRLLELPPSEPQWLQSLLQLCDCEFVWDATRGKPRAAASDDMEGMEDQDEIQIDGVDRIGNEGQADAQNNKGTLGTYVPRTLLLHIYQVGLQILDALGHEMWARLSHLGWRSFKALGLRRAKELWTHIGDNCITKWKMNYVYAPVPGFPADGLTSKVLLDRIREVTVLTGVITDKQFLHRYCPVPRIPAVGNAARVLALFDFRSMILGADACPIRIPPQVLHRIQKRLHPILQKEGRQLGLPAPKLLWPHVENVLCCYGKIIDGMFDLPGHAAY